MRLKLPQLDKISTGNMQAGVRKFPANWELASYGIFL